ncbi:uncharacterized protein LOC122545202, partial [Chiloscyllium plagiosum]|uniref:uncharacterized protein LOC122545202 n=1 Tax=Chiloscyllium plagiosum TaxID=36176 RepID=UPI001CB7B641
CQGETVTLRSVKSEESLTSQHSGAGTLRCPSLHVQRVSVEEGVTAANEDAEDIYAVPEPRHGTTCSGLGPESRLRTPAISNPLSTSVPAEVLQMLGCWAGEPQASAWSPAQTISLLLETRQLQRRDSGAREAGSETEDRGDSPGPELPWTSEGEHSQLGHPPSTPLRPHHYPQQIGLSDLQGHSPRQGVSGKEPQGDGRRPFSPSSLLPHSIGSPPNPVPTFSPIAFHSSVC